MGNQNGEEHGSVTPYQLTATIVGTVIGVGVLAFPRLIVEAAGTAAPLAALLGAIPPLVAWLCKVQLERWWPGRSPVETYPAIVTRPIGWFLAAIEILFLMTVTALTVREFGDVVKTAVLPNTPIEVTISLMILAATYFVRYDVQVIARVYEIFFPLMITPLAVIGLLSLKNARAYYLQPFLGVGWMGILKGSLMASVGYLGFVIGAFLLPSLNRPKQAVRAGVWGIGLSLFVYMLAVTASLSVFGPEEMKHLIWPTYELIKTTAVPGFILERLESAFLGIWVAAVFTTVGATYYTALLSITQLFKLGDHKTMAIPLVPILYLIAMAPPNIHALYRVVTVVGLFGVAFTMGLPLLLLPIGFLRKRGAEPDATKA